MRFVFAPDSFKGTLSASRICDLLEVAARRHYENVDICRVPLADGGEGTVEALLDACGGDRLFYDVTGPYGDPVRAEYARLGEGVYAMEIAQTSGLTLSEKREPMEASSVGSGELLKHLLSLAPRRILIGLGGSATNDGGAGLLYAMGARFFDVEGNEVYPNGGALSRITDVNLFGLISIPESTQVEVMCDVRNPLTGPEGATYVYGPQKGATARTLPLLEAGISSFARIVSSALGRECSSFPGAGAAGGLGFALGGVLGATMRSGVNALLEYAHFDDILTEADLCVTGEGRLDGQSVLYGKAVSGIACACANHGVPLAVITGGLGDGARDIYGICPCALMVTPDRPMSLNDALADAERLFADAADRLFRTLRIGSSLALRSK